MDLPIAVPFPNSLYDVGGPKALSKLLIYCCTAWVGQPKISTK